MSALFLRFERVVHRWFVQHSVALLRISLGAVFLGFGVIKYYPHASPAEGLVEATMSQLTLGLVDGRIAMIVVATVECVIGLSLLTGTGLRIVIYLLGFECAGILSPLVVVPYRLFTPGPTLEAQYVIKDIILVTATMVVIAASFRGARIAYRDSEPAATDPVAEYHKHDGSPSDPDRSQTTDHTHPA